MNETDYNEKTCLDSAKILYNYPPKGKWIVVEIYREAERRGKYRALWNDPEGGKGGEVALVFTKSFW